MFRVCLVQQRGGEGSGAILMKGRYVNKIYVWFKRGEGRGSEVF
jgi:hypothetical protein